MQARVRPLALAAGDFNGDGKLELAAADWGSERRGADARSAQAQKWYTGSPIPKTGQVYRVATRSILHKAERVAWIGSVHR